MDEELELIKRAVMIICRSVRPDGDLSSLDYEDACKMQEIYHKLVKGGETKRPIGTWLCTFHSSFPQYEPDEYRCSICNGIGRKTDKICKHCGADMKGGEEE